MSLLVKASGGDTIVDVAMDYVGFEVIGLDGAISPLPDSSKLVPGGR